MRTLFLTLTIALVILSTGLVYSHAAAALTDIPNQAQPENPCGTTYRIARGDTLSRIAVRCNTTVAALLRANPHIQNPDRIYAGQPLQLVPPGMGPVIPQTGAGQLELDPELLKKNAERWIDVDLSTQTVSAYSGTELVRTFVVSTGKPRTPTVTGEYRIYVKHRFTDMRGPGYHLRDVPYTMYFYRGYGLHGTYWHNNFGTPMSAGCVNLTIEDAEWLFNFAPVGTRVNVHY